MISFAALGNKTYGDADFTVNATASSWAGGEPRRERQLRHHHRRSLLSTRRRKLHHHRRAERQQQLQPGAGVSRMFSIAQADQAITFQGIADKTYGDADFALDATASSGLPVNFSVSGAWMITGAALHLSGAGACTVAATQSGDANYTPALTVAQSFSIAKASQAITFDTPGNTSYRQPASFSPPPPARASSSP